MQVVSLADGRGLAFRSDGPRRGFPIVYLHGAIGAPVVPTPELQCLLEDLHVRHIAVSRPGFGASDPLPGRTIAGFADDVRQLADALGLWRFAIVGVSAGGPYALACAQRLHGRVSQTALVSSIVPGAAPHADMRRHLRLALGVLERHPRGVERLGAPLVGAATRRAGRRECCARGLIDDYLLSCAPWGFDPAGTAGVRLWHGEGDHLVPAARARELAAQLPGCQARFGKRDGHFFYRRRMPEILGALRERPSSPAIVPLAA